jgi:soluble lytic murein transglycosylase
VGSNRCSNRRPYTVAVTALAVCLAFGDKVDLTEISFTASLDEPRSSVEYVQVSKLLASRFARLSEGEVAVLAQVIVEAESAGLAPELVAAVIDVESSGNRLAVSRVGAMGLMQVRPETAESIATRAGVDWRGPETLFDPVSNVRIGVSYLDELVDRFGDLHIALAAYNWGPTRIARHIREGSVLPVRYSERVLQVYETLI